MKTFTVNGMSCASCSSKVEKTVSKLDGVSQCSVNLLTNSMNVETSLSDEEIISAVRKAGYDAFVKGSSKKQSNDDTNKHNGEFSVLLKRLVSSIFFLAVLMYFSMVHMKTAMFSGNYIAVALTQMLLAIIIIVINKKFFISGFKSLIRLSPNMDTLVAIGASASFIYSLYELFKMTYFLYNALDISSLANNMYFESSAMILTLVTVGKMLEARSKGKTTDAIKRLMELSPQTATLIRDGNEIIVDASDVIAGDIFIVRPGEKIPVDGQVIEGTGAVNESSLTGESIPADKKEGDNVSSATINISGFLKCKATRVGEDTTLSQIIKMVSDASSSKAPISKIADKVSGIFVPSVIFIAIVTAVIWMIVGKSFGFSIERAVSVLVISCPCALGLATPVAVMVGNGVGAKNGILFKNAQSLENAGKLKTIVLDKTGTITTGKPAVTELISFCGNKQHLLSIAYSLEDKSEHPIAKAIVESAQIEHAERYEIKNFKAIFGCGLYGEYQGKSLFAGNYNYIQNNVSVPYDIKEKYDKLCIDGKTPLLFCEDGKIIGIICVEDKIKSDSKEAISELKKLGLNVVMLTGDNKGTAKAIGEKTGIDKIISDVLPGSKEKAVNEMKTDGLVGMVGDGTNDAPALTSADVGIAIGAGTDIAIDSADVVLVSGRLTDVVRLIKISRATLKNIKENLFWAFFYNCLGIPLAAGAFISLLHWQLSPMFGAAAMSLSSICVVLNALRLNMFKIKNSIENKEFTKREEKFTQMEKVIKIEGMMCGHCENRVKTALEKLEGVDSAQVSCAQGVAILHLNKDLPDSQIYQSVENEGYKVIKE